ncbi:MAG: hypothetical protein KAU20_04780, partial [Nanoarchaeota archaeon]|nr:hypothetical protein [Nanoarchaeota archaeon]
EYLPSIPSLELDYMEYSSNASAQAAYVSSDASGYTAITNCTELQAMQNNPGGNYWLANDIDVSACGYSPITSFTGIFDGNGHSITGLSSSSPGCGGGFVNCNRGIIKNCVFAGHVQGVYHGSGYYDIGGIAGCNYGLITNCHSAVTVSADNRVGGIAGDNTNGGTITYCSSSGAINGVYRVGGLVGRNHNYGSGGTIRNCYSTSAVGGNGKYDGVGGLIGSNYRSITNCYSTGLVSAGGYVGGLIGRHFSGTYNDCFWDTETSGRATSAGGTGKNTTQMKQEATFLNWNFVTIWNITENVTYPFLQPITGGDFVSNLQSYSEPIIKQQGSYSLKGIAKQTDSLSDTLTKTLSPTKDLTGKNIIKLDARASRTGSNFKISIHDSGGTTTEHTINIASANIWQTESWDISGVSDANKDAINQIKITIL